MGIEEVMDNVELLSDEITALQAEIESYQHRIGGKNRSAIRLLIELTKDWQPFYNEKAVCLSFESHFAYYVWFTERRQNSLRFREVPNESETIFNFVRQDLDSVDSEPWDRIVIPLELFMRLNDRVEFELDDKSEYARIPNW